MMVERRFRRRRSLRSILLFVTGFCGLFVCFSWYTLMCCRTNMYGGYIINNYPVYSLRETSAETYIQPDTSKQISRVADSVVQIGGIVSPGDKFESEDSSGSNNYDKRPLGDTNRIDVDANSFDDKETVQSYLEGRYYDLVISLPETEVAVDKTGESPAVNAHASSDHLLHITGETPADIERSVEDSVTYSVTYPSTLASANSQASTETGHSSNTEQPQSSKQLRTPVAEQSYQMHDSKKTIYYGNHITNTLSVIAKTTRPRAIPPTFAIENDFQKTTNDDHIEKSSFNNVHPSSQTITVRTPLTFHPHSILPTLQPDQYAVKAWLPRGIKERTESSSQESLSLPIPSDPMDQVTGQSLNTGQVVQTVSSHQEVLTPVLTNDIERQISLPKTSIGHWVVNGQLSSHQESVPLPILSDTLDRVTGRNTGQVIHQSVVQMPSYQEIITPVLNNDVNGQIQLPKPSIGHLLANDHITLSHRPLTYSVTSNVDGQMTSHQELLTPVSTNDVDGEIPLAKSSTSNVSTGPMPLSYVSLTHSVTSGVDGQDLITHVVTNDVGGQPSLPQQSLTHQEIGHDVVVGESKRLKRNIVVGEPVKRLPQALIIGVKKCGTRALLEFLRIHPDIRASGPETHFFDRHYQRGLEWYRHQMPPSLEGQITMEKTPSYFITRDAPPRIRSALAPTLRLLVVVRDPVTRAVSDYTQSASKRTTSSKSTFEEMAFLNASTGLVDTSWPAIRLGVYARFLEWWTPRHFPKNHILFISGEELVRDPAAEMARVQDFLGIKRIVSEKHFYFNETKGFPCLKKSEGSGNPHCLGKTKGRAHPDISTATIQRLRDFYRPFNVKFYQMVGRNFGWP